MNPEQTLSNKQLLAGLLLVILGGVMEGAYALPLKFTPKWNWENTWGMASLSALLLVPWTLAVITVPNLLDLYRQISVVTIAWTLLFGMAWGIGGVLLGLSINMVGIALGFSIVLGIIAIDGSLIPLLWHDPEKILSGGGLWFLASMLVFMIGTGICAVAGKRKEEEATPNHTDRKGGYFRIGLILCIISGLMCGCVNFALIFGTEITHRATELGTRPLFAADALWALVFTTNYLANIVYCVYLVWRNKSSDRFFAKGTGGYWLQAILMGIVWATGIVVYGIGAFKLGRYGAFIGFPAMIATSILTANLLGWLTGEWKSVSTRVSRIMLLGVGTLVIAISLLATADHMIAR